MSLVQGLAVLALEQIIDGACRAVGVVAPAGTVQAVTRFLDRHFSDSAQQLDKALRVANDRAWRSLELALAGTSLWDNCKNFFAQADQKAFAHQVRAFLDAN